MKRWILGSTLVVVAAASGYLTIKGWPGTRREVATWPNDLLENLTEITLQRFQGSEPVRRRRVFRNPHGVWWIESPRRGEADPDTVGRLLFALKAPLLATQPSDRAQSDERIAFVIDLRNAEGGLTQVKVFSAPLGEPIRVNVQNSGDFWVDPVEFGTKVPDPDELLPAGLWISAHQKTLSLKVTGPVNYALHVTDGGTWVSDDGRNASADLGDFPAMITTRQAVDHPEPTSLQSLGLEPPIATAELCDRVGCRAFRFGKVDANGRTRYFAQGPDEDPLEMRDEAWRLVVEGPFR